MPGAEFTIGPIAFRVLYEHRGDLESVPAARFVDEVEGATEIGHGHAASAGVEELPMFEVEEASPAKSAGNSESGEIAMPSFMDLADADPDAVFPAQPVGPTEVAAGYPGRFVAASGPRQFSHSAADECHGRAHGG